MSSPFGDDVSFEDFKASASTYFITTADIYVIDAACAKNGFKALTLLYFAHGPNWTHDEVNESVAIIESAAKRLIEIEKR